MHFDFSETTHQWCVRCAGNIRRSASHCRLCQTNFGSKFQSIGQNAEPSVLINAVACWLPKFNELMLRSGPELQERIRQADLEYAKTFRESESAHLAQTLSNRSSSTTCGDSPPEPREAALLQDILLNLHERGEDLKQLCAEPTLVLLDITATSIIQESELRISEQSENNPCKFCHEFILSSSQQCRFCGSDGQSPPKRKLTLMASHEQPDLDFLTSIILWEAARKQAESQPPIPPEILESYQINSEKIEREVVRQRTNPTDFPRTSWRKRTSELQLTPRSPLEELEICDLIYLGLACQRSNDAEAEIVYNHGLQRANSFSNPLFVKQTMLDGLKQVYLNRKDFEAHHRIKEEVANIRETTVHEPIRQELKNTEKDIDAMLRRVTMGDKADPEKRLEDNAARLKKYKEQQEKMIEHASSPEVRKYLENTLAMINKVAGPAQEIAKLTTDAVNAKNASDFDKADALIDEALSKLSDQWTWTDCVKRCGLLSLKAGVQMSLGKPQVAEDLYLQSIRVAEEMEELGDGRECFPVMQACSDYAKFLVPLERFEEAEKYFTKSLQMSKQQRENFAQESGSTRSIASPMEAHLCEEIAKVMRLTNRAEQAVRMEEQAAEIKRQVEKRENEIANDRRNYLEMVTEPPPPPPSAPGE